MKKKYKVSTRSEKKETGKLKQIIESRTRKKSRGGVVYLVSEESKDRPLRGRGGREAIKRV